MRKYEIRVKYIGVKFVRPFVKNCLCFCQVEKRVTDQQTDRQAHCVRSTLSGSRIKWERGERGGRKLRNGEEPILERKKGDRNCQHFFLYRGHGKHYASGNARWVDTWDICPWPQYIFLPVRLVQLILCARNYGMRCSSVGLVVRLWVVQQKSCAVKNKPLIFRPTQLRVLYLRTATCFGINRPKLGHQ